MTDADFLRSFEWRRLRYQVLKKHGRRCMCCGRSPEQGIEVNVDHIRPRKTHPHLALDENNLQVLCADCNHGKGSRYADDFRPLTAKDHPFEVLNRAFALVVSGNGGHILWETKNERGGYVVQHLNLDTFHRMFAPWTIHIDGKYVPVTEKWLTDSQTRKYDGICFDPSAGPEVIGE